MAYAAFPQVDDKLKDQNLTNSSGGGGGIVGGEGGGPSQGGQLTQARAPNAFLDANKGAEASDVTSPFKDKIETERGNVKKAESEYEGKLGGADQLNKSDIDAGLGGANDKFQQISNRLSGQYMGGQAPTYNYNQQGIKNLNLVTQGVNGTEQLLKQTHGPGYTTGMARMDARLNQMNPNYQQNIQNVLQSKEGLDSDAAAAKAQAQAALTGKQSAYDAYTGQLKNDLTGIGKGLQDSWKTGLTAAQQKLQSDYQQGLNAALTSGSAAAINNPNNEYSKAKAEAQKYLDQLKYSGVEWGTTGGQSQHTNYLEVDPSVYGNLANALSYNPAYAVKNNLQGIQGSVGLGDVASAEDQAKFSRLNQLLGGSLGNQDFTKGKANQFSINQGGVTSELGESASRINSELAALKNLIATTPHNLLAKGQHNIGATPKTETDIGSASGDYVKLPDGRTVNIWSDPEGAAYARAHGLRRD